MPADSAAFLPPSLGENETTQANSSQRDVRRSSADQRPFVVWHNVLERLAREALASAPVFAKT
jgi:hypothetical protein